MMLIRSQDRKTLMPIGTLECGTKPYPHIENTFDGVGGSVGTYDSESRCLEILDDIQEMSTRDFHQNVFQMPEK